MEVSFQISKTRMRDKKEAGSSETMNFSNFAAVISQFNEKLQEMTVQKDKVESELGKWKEKASAAEKRAKKAVQLESEKEAQKQEIEILRTKLKSAENKVQELKDEATAHAKEDEEDRIAREAEEERKTKLHREMYNGRLQVVHAYKVYRMHHKENIAKIDLLLEEREKLVNIVRARSTAQQELKSILHDTEEELQTVKMKETSLSDDLEQEKEKCAKLETAIAESQDEVKNLKEVISQFESEAKKSKDKRELRSSGGPELDSTGVEEQSKNLLDIAKFVAAFKNQNDWLLRYGSTLEENGCLKAVDKRALTIYRSLQEVISEEKFVKEPDSFGAAPYTPKSDITILHPVAEKIKCSDKEQQTDKSEKVYKDAFVQTKSPKKKSSDMEPKVGADVPGEESAKDESGGDDIVTGLNVFSRNDPREPSVRYMFVRVPITDAVKPVLSDLATGTANTLEPGKSPIAAIPKFKAIRIKEKQLSRSLMPEPSPSKGKKRRSQRLDSTPSRNEPALKRSSEHLMYPQKSLEETPMTQRKVSRSSCWSPPCAQSPVSIQSMSAAASPTNIHPMSTESPLRLNLGNLGAIYAFQPKEEKATKRSQMEMDTIESEIYSAIGKLTCVAAREDLKFGAAIEITNALLRAETEEHIEFAIEQCFGYFCCSKQNRLEEFVVTLNKKHVPICDEMFVIPDEQCFAACITRCTDSKGPDFILNKFMHMVVSMIKDHERAPSQIFGLAALCRTFTIVCKIYDKLSEARNLCYNLMLERRMPEFPYLVASIAITWQDVLNFGNVEGRSEALYRSVSYVLSHKPMGLSEEYYRQSCLVFEKVCGLLINKYENGHDACDTIMSMIEKKSDECLYPEDEAESYLLALELIAVKEGWLFVKEVMIKRILPYVDIFRKKRISAADLYRHLLANLQTMPHPHDDEFEEDIKRALISDPIIEAMRGRQCRSDCGDDVSEVCSDVGTDLEVSSLQ